MANLRGSLLMVAATVGFALEDVMIKELAGPRWFMVDVKFVRNLDGVITLRGLKSCKTPADMRLVQKGSRLSIMPVTKRQWDFILKLEGKS